MIAIALFGIYAVSTFGMYQYNRAYYGPRGHLAANWIDSFDVFVTLMPVMNTVGNIMWLFHWPYKSNPKKHRARSFFNL